jgi:hypothetical protein
MAFNGDDHAGDPAQHGRRIARAGADFEHLVAWPHIGGLGNRCDDVRLRDGLSFGDRQGAVLVSELLETCGDKIFPRHFAHGG